LNAALKNQQPKSEYKRLVNLIDEFSKRHNLQCSSCDEDSYYRRYGFHSISLVSNIDEKTGTFSIDLSEFGPIGATKKYEALHKELSDLIKKNFKEGSVILDNPQCGMK